MINFTNLTQSNYESLRFNILLNVEEGGEVKLTPYLDSKNIPTIGLGMNLRDSGVLDEIMDVFGIGDGEDYRRDMKGVISSPHNSVSSLQSQLNAIMLERANDPGITVENKRSSFSFNDEDEVKEVFNSIITTYEGRVDSWLTGIPIYSSERAVLVSLSYNGVLEESNKLKTAIKDGNRPEAWYEIRYQSNGDKLDGIAKRRYYESQILSLYDDANSVNATEAKAVFKMFNNGDHRSKILSYDKKYQKMVAKANSDYGISIVQDWDESISAAKTILIDTYAPGKTFEEVLVDKDGSVSVDTRNYNPKDQSRLIFGEDGNDVIAIGDGDNVIYGGDGKDSITSGTGENTIHGEGELDTYKLSSLSKNTQIIDSDKNGVVVIDGKRIEGAAKAKASSDGVVSEIWTIDQGYDLHKRTNDESGNDLVIIKSGSNIDSSDVGRVTIKDYDFESNEAPFGINLGGRLNGGYGLSDLYEEEEMIQKVVFAGSDPRGRFFIPVYSVDTATQTSSVGIRIFDASGIEQETNYFKQVTTSDGIGRAIRATSNNYILEDGNIVFAYTTLESGPNYVGSSSAFLVIVDSLGKIVSNREVYKTISDGGRTKFYNNILVNSFISNKGVCFVANRQNICGELDANELMRVPISTPYRGLTQDNDHAILASGHKVDILYSGSYPRTTKIFIFPPTYSQIPDDEIIVNYTAEQGDQVTPSDLDKFIISAPQEGGSNLKISPAPNSYGVLLGYGLDNNPEAKIDLSEFDVSDVKIYQSDASKYSIDGILEGKFVPDSEPLFLENIEVRRRLDLNATAGNSTDNAQLRMMIIT